MRILAKFFNLSYLITILISCTSHSSQQSQQIPHQAFPISYTPMELDTLYKPLYRDSFILQEKHDEFRHPVEQQFPMKQRLAHDTWILEFTWRVKDDTLITVWYIRESDTLRILDRYIYSEHAEF